MGLFDKLRNELIDIIEWVDDSRRTLAWRFPRYQNEIKNGAQLIVRPRSDGCVRPSRRDRGCVRARAL
jgi:membrane protease subunit (stomatin/prohibitin family)